jgi:hypothetical protein
MLIFRGNSETGRRMEDEMEGEQKKSSFPCFCFCVILTEDDAQEEKKNYA